METQTPEAPEIDVTPDTPEQPSVMPQPTAPVTTINGFSMIPAGVASFQTGLGFQTEVR